MRPKCTNCGERHATALCPYEDIPTALTSTPPPMNENPIYYHQIPKEKLPESSQGGGELPDNSIADTQQSDQAEPTAVEKAMKSMEGKQMPVLIGGENWWPQRYVDAERTKAEQAGYERGKREEIESMVMLRANERD